MNIEREKLSIMKVLTEMEKFRKGIVLILY